MKKVAIYSGQGSQYVGMLNDYYEGSDVAKSIIEQANSILGYSLSEICFNGPVETLKETRYTQPAIFLHSVIAHTLSANKVKFGAVAGHSVGEFAALFAAGVISFEDGLKLVSLRGKLMFEAGESTPGTMFAVIGMEDEKLIDICQGLNNGDKVVVPANFNSPGQIVVSGSRDYLRQIAPTFKENGARMVVELPVSGAFHSPLMQPAKEELASAINAINFSDATVPVYNNVDANPETKADALKEKLIEQLTSPVKWTQTLVNLQSDGYTDFVEIGPGNVLQGLCKRTLKDITISGIDKYQDLQNV